MKLFFIWSLSTGQWTLEECNQGWVVTMILMGFYLKKKEVLPGNISDSLTGIYQMEMVRIPFNAFDIVTNASPSTIESLSTYVVHSWKFVSHSFYFSFLCVSMKIH